MAQYSAVLTTYGTQELAKAIANNQPLRVTHFAVGDGNGQAVTVSADRTALVKETHRAPVSAVSLDPRNNKQVIFELTIPENVGGFYIREIGVFDAQNKLIAYANCPESFKPTLQSGSGKIQVMRMILLVANSNAITLTVDDSVIFVTRGQLTPRTITATSTNGFDQHGHSHQIDKASTTQAGIVQLTNDTGLDSDKLALTARAGKVLSQAINAVRTALNNYIPNNKKSNSVDSDSTDTVATSAAAKKAYDKAVDAKSAADNAQQTANAALPLNNTRSKEIIIGSFKFVMQDDGNFVIAKTATNEVVYAASLWVKKTGDTLTGKLSLPTIHITQNTTGESVQLGDDVYLGDVDMRDTLGVKGKNNPNQGYIAFGTNKAKFGYDGANLGFFGINNSFKQLFPNRSGMLALESEVLALSNTNTPILTVGEYKYRFQLDGNFVVQNKNNELIYSAFDFIQKTDISHIINGTALNKVASEYALGLLNKKITNEKLIWQGAQSGLTVNVGVDKGLLIILFSYRGRLLWNTVSIAHCHNTSIGFTEYGGENADKDNSATIVVTRNGTNITFAAGLEIRKVILLGG